MVHIYWHAEIKDAWKWRFWPQSRPPYSHVHRPKFEQEESWSPANREGLCVKTVWVCTGLSLLLFGGSALHPDRLIIGEKFVPRATISFFFLTVDHSLTPLINMWIKTSLFDDQVIHKQCCQSDCHQNKIPVSTADCFLFFFFLCHLTSRPVLQWWWKKETNKPALLSGSSTAWLSVRQRYRLHLNWTI